MPTEPMEFSEHYRDVMQILTGPGLLLGSYDAVGKANLMTIGWGAIGSIWSIEQWIVLVRPSRYTYECIEHTGGFTVNVPTAAMREVCSLCGTKSGRDMDKFAASGLTAVRAENVLAPVVAECPIAYECQVVHSNDVLPAKLNEGIVSGSYPSGDFHRLYFGKILSAKAEPNAADLL